MIISNFLYRAAQYLHEHRARLIKILLILAAAILAFVVILTAFEEWKYRQYRQKLNALDAQVQAAETKAKDAEARADAKQVEIDATKAEAKELAKRADLAETAMRNTGQKVVTLKETYEEIRNNPMPAADVSCADACRDLAAVGYACQ